MNSENGERFSEGALYTKNTKNSEERYKGTVFLLISERTGSAAIDFASIFKFHQMGTIVGRETYHPDSFSGNITYHSLPNSGLIFANSVTYSIAARGNDDGRGVMPDYSAKYNLEDHLNNIDRDLETVSEIVSKKENN
ncbi:MAG: S41 family peptidase [Bacteroidota bacterium]